VISEIKFTTNYVVSGKNICSGYEALPRNQSFEAPPHIDGVSRTVQQQMVKFAPIENKTAEPYRMGYEANANTLIS